MIDDTFDKTDYKFGVLIIPNRFRRSRVNFRISNSHYQSELNNIFDEEVLHYSYVIDFDDISGLKIDELFEDPKTGGEYLFFIMYDSYDKKEKDIHYVFLIKRYKANKEMSVDDYIIKMIDEAYPRMDEGAREFADTFVERYKGNSKEETEEMVNCKIKK